MEQIDLKATLREGRGKSAAKKLRDQGLVPGTVYHRGEDSVSISVSSKELFRIIHSAGGENVLIKLNVEGDKKGKARLSILKEVQHHPVKRAITHVDFNEISLKEKITMHVPIVAKGESIGVKQEEGVLDQPLRELEVECLPTDIPKTIPVDISGLALNQSLHAKDLVVPSGVEVITDPEALVFHVGKHREEVVEEVAPAEGEEGPEVIREKKEGEEEGEKGGEEKKPEAKEQPKEEKK